MKMKKHLWGALAALAVTGTLFAAPATAGGTATVNVVHGIPGVPVKVCVDGSVVDAEFKYGSKIVGAELPAGNHKVKLVGTDAGCGAAAILAARYDLKAGSNVTIVAALNGSGAPRLKVFSNNVKPVDPDMARLSVRHTAHAPAVNVWANGAPLIDGNDFTFGKSATVTVPADDYKVKVTLPGETAPVIGPAVLTLDEGRAYQVYAVGNADTWRLVVVKAKVGTN
jgi:hypothetical protein